jgi:aminoglycoside phosphotransferase (APT) family kinase protein
MTPEERIRFINAAHGTTFEIRKPLGGGYQEGAWEVADRPDRRAVLKLTRVPRALPVIRQLRAVGYPAPEILFWGVMPDGTPYHLQEFLPGTPIEILTPDQTEQLIALNRLQAGLASPGERPDGNWSDYATGVVFADESDWAFCLRKHSRETARLMAALERVTAPYAGIELPCGDAVHGDWSPGNMLAEGSQLTGIVDCSAAGYGTRAIDLASLLHYAYMDEYDDPPGGAVRAVLWDELRSVGDAGMRVVLLAYRVMALVEFAVRCHGEEGVAAFVAVGCRILEDPRVRRDSA